MIKPKKTFVPSNTEFIISDIELIEPDANRVTLANGKRVIQYDQLLVATGTDIHPEETQGLSGAGWHKNIFDFYTYEGTVALSKFLNDFRGGRVVINVAEMPIKCPVAPLEFSFLADDYFEQRGLRSKVEIIYTNRFPAHSQTRNPPLCWAVCWRKRASIWNLILPSAMWMPVKT